MQDVIIIGGGPAGYTAAMYCARAALSVTLLETFAPGGQMGTTETLENYPGFPQGVGGFELAQSMKQQAENFGAVTKLESVESAELSSAAEKIVHCTSGSIYKAPVVIVASGGSPRELGLPNERALRGKGVSYCATCDGMFFRGKEVVVVGGGDTAAADAVYLARICKKVTVIHRRDTLRASRAYLEPLKKAENIDFLWDSVVTEIVGAPVSGVKTANKKTGEVSSVPCKGVFVAVGNLPNTAFLKGQISLTNGGYVDAGEDTCTNVPGVFAAGDVRRKPLRQVVTAVSDGAVAAHMAEDYLMKLSSKS
ncbi:MAG: thioredoxin-disulfide reductase [Oscillospiraceae bacterium]|jgi:thioredoxin reductase (NADPH)|nr:thioredoxin-disulfide reductase [Oscillospiraceae bacterium]